MPVLSGCQRFQLQRGEDAEPTFADPVRMGSEGSQDRLVHFPGLDTFGQHRWDTAGVPGHRQGRIQSVAAGGDRLMDNSGLEAGWDQLKKAHFLRLQRATAPPQPFAGCLLPSFVASTLFESL